MIPADVCRTLGGRPIGKDQDGVGCVECRHRGCDISGIEGGGELVLQVCDSWVHRLFPLRLRPAYVAEYAQP